MEKNTGMPYRFLGRTGIQVSAIGYGNMVFNKVTEENIDNCYKCITKVFEKGVNFFDTAEIYGEGNAEIVLGKCLKKAGWPRKDYVLSTKIYRCGNGPNDAFLSRKHIIEGLNASLARLQVDYVDIVFAHRHDSETPIEEICRAFDWVIRQGKAFYWGTSIWTAEQIMEAFECCDRLGLIKPVADQVGYNLLNRANVEGHYVPLFEKYGHGTTIYSPLAGGYLTGKYNDGNIPEDTRYSPGKFSAAVIESLNAMYVGKDKELFLKRLRGLGEIAKEMKCTQAQLALAWCLVNKDVSTAVIGSTKPHQLDDSLGALELMKKWTPELEKKIEEVMQNKPEPQTNFRTWQPFPDRRSVSVEYPKAQ